jgi:hypothetical protein
MRHLAVLCGALIVASLSFAVSPRQILPAEAVYDPAIPTPEKVLGFPIGERHLQHHELVGYLGKLAEASPRVKIEEYARSYGGRRLMYAIVTSPENHRRIEEIRKQHLTLTSGKLAEAVTADTTMPAIVVMGYGVHGNEPSASNVAPLVAYHLAASTGKDHEKLLNDLVILIDPCLNPDGFERFANWANDNRGAVINPDPATREHREPWPGGRTNYYWFDLNRDWLPVQHPESQGRLAMYQKWKPNLVLDYHEMGSTSTYFFQPGDPKRVHPLIPARNQELTELLGRRHGLALDKIGSLYFTQDQFDDYYPGKGSTYPDLHGAVGILFEQASSRGHVQDTPNGRLTFPFTIRNQFTTSLSSLAGVHALRPAFLEHQRKFYAESLADGAADPVRGYLVAAPHDPARLYAFLDLLHRHDIQAYQTAPTWDFGPGVARGDVYWIPNAQPEYRFLQALFEQRTEFANTVFYDISAWTVPLAFGLKVREVKEPIAIEGKQYQPGKVAPHAVEFSAEADVGYLIDWRGLHAPATLAKLLAAGVAVRVAGEEVAPTFAGGKYPPGTLMVHVVSQPEKRAAIVEILKQAAAQGVRVVPVGSGLTPQGPDLGSAAFSLVGAPRVLLVVGDGVNQYEAGEVWHALDRRVGLPVTLVETSRLGSTDLSRYSVVVMVSGSYASLTAGATDRLKEYVTRGGTLLAQGTAINWVKARGLASVTLREPRAEEKQPSLRPYNQASDDATKHAIRGAILAATVDSTHPLGFGYDASTPLSLFRSNRVILERSTNPYCTPVVYTEKPLQAGYISGENQDLLAKSGAAVVVGSGAGRVLLLPDAANFRAYWLGSQRLFLNATFFGPQIRVPGAGGAADPGDEDEGF